MIDRLSELVQLALHERDPMHLQVLADALEDEGLPLFARCFRGLDAPCWDLIALFQDKIENRKRFRAEADIEGHYPFEWNRYLEGLADEP